MQILKCARELLPTEFTVSYFFFNFIPSVELLPPLSPLPDLLYKALKIESTQNLL